MISIVIFSSVGVDLGFLVKDIVEFVFVFVIYSLRVRVSDSFDCKFLFGCNGGLDEIDIIDIFYWELRIMVVGMVICFVGNIVCFSCWGDLEGKYFRCCCFCDFLMVVWIGVRWIECGVLWWGLFELLNVGNVYCMVIRKFGSCK